MQKNQLKNKFVSFIKWIAAYLYQIWCDVVWPRLYAYFSGPHHFFRRTVLYSLVGHFVVFLFFIVDMSFFQKDRELNFDDISMVDIIFDEEIVENIPIPPGVIKPNLTIAKPLPPVQKPAEKIPEPPKAIDTKPMVVSQPITNKSQEIQSDESPIPLPPHRSRKLKTVQKPETESPKKTEQDDQFFDMLKDLSADDLTAEKKEEELQKQVIKKFSANERDMINQQISQNWNKPPAAMNVDLTIEVQIKIDLQASVKSTKIISIEGDASPSLKKIIAVSVERAIQKSSPLLLPQDKADLWKKGIILNFYTNRG